MYELIDIYPEFAARRFEFSCLRKFTAGSASNWHMLCFYNSIAGGKLAWIQSFIKTHV